MLCQIFLELCFKWDWLRLIFGLIVPFARLLPLTFLPDQTDRFGPFSLSLEQSSFVNLRASYFYVKLIVIDLNYVTLIGFKSTFSRLVITTILHEEVDGFLFFSC